MANGLQTIINVADSLAFDRRKVVGIQYTRSEIPKVSETPTRNPWRMSLTVPSILPYNDYRDLLEQLDNLDRRYPQVISFNDNPNLSWICKYRGDLTLAQTQSLVVNSFTTNQMVLGNLPTAVSIPNGANGYIFKAGDFIQVTGFPFPFTVVNDVIRGNGSTVTVTTHRPNFIPNIGTAPGLLVGNAVNFKVFCPNMPTYKLVPGGSKYQNGVIVNNAYIEFSGAFNLYEWVGDV